MESVSNLSVRWMVGIPEKGRDLQESRYTARATCRIIVIARFSSETSSSFAIVWRNAIGFCSPLPTSVMMMSSCKYNYLPNVYVTECDFFYVNLALLV